MLSPIGKLRHSNKVIIYVLSLCFLAYEMGIQIVPSVFSQDLSVDFHFGSREIGIVSGSYFITYGLMQLPAGVIYDFFSLRKIMLLSVLACAIGILAFAGSTSIYTLILSRLLMGAGSAFAFTATLVIPICFFSRKHFAIFVALTQLTACLGAFGSQYILSRVIQTCAWTSITYVLALIGFSLVMMIFMSVPKKVNDIGEPVTLKLMLLNLITVMKSKQNWYCGIYAFALWAPMGAFASLWGIDFLEIKYSISASDAALLCGFIWIGLGIGSPAIGFIFRNKHNKQGLLSGLSVLGFVALYIILFTYVPHRSLLSLGLFALGVACVGQLMTFEYVQHNNKHTQVATAIGFNNMFIVCSSLIMQPVIGFIIDSPYYGALTSVDSYVHGLSPLLGLLVCAGILSTFFIKKKPGHTS